MSTLPERGHGADAGLVTGDGGVGIAGSNRGNVNTGWQFIGQYLAGVSAEGRERLSASELTEKVRQYLSWLQEGTQHITLRGIERSGGAKVVQLPVERAYVPLQARRQALPFERDINVDQLLGLGNRLVVIGGPGSGKTTVLLHMAWALAKSLLDGQPEPARSHLGLQESVSSLPLPLFIPLASFARYRRRLPPSSPAEHGTLRYFITQYLVSNQATFGLPSDFFEQLLIQDRHVLLLLDGLDEVANQAERYSVREQVERLVIGRERKNLRTVVTCRTVTYQQGRTALAAGFEEIKVQPLGFEAHVVPLVRQAYACIHARDVMQSEKSAADLLAGIRRLESDRRARHPGGGARALVTSPLMVRLLIIVHYNQRTLPDQRAELFDKAVSSLLQVDYGPDEDNAQELSAHWETLLDLAQHLAWHMHSQGAEQGREIQEEELARILAQDQDLAPYAEAFVAHARQRGSLVEERDDTYRFLHLALQEFLVARFLREVVAGTQGLPALVALLQDKVTDPWWREPILLALGYRTRGAQNTVRALIGLLLDSASTSASARQPSQALGAAELAGTAAADWADSGVQLRQTTTSLLARLLGDDEILRSTAAPLRARAGEVLSRLGDPRFDPGCLHLPACEFLGFVHVAADPNFRIGTPRHAAERVASVTGARAYESEFNETVTPSPEFWIAKYPVTVAQFRRYVEATGVRPRDARALQDHDSRPVRWVSWHEASQYAAWLHSQLRDAPASRDSPVSRLVRGGTWQVGLPSELEWEKAARGGREGQVFPWGDQPDPLRANYAQSGVGSSSAVGCFAPNDYGLFDMVGNVWQWTRSVWHYRLTPEKLYAETAELAFGDRLVARGGSWSSHSVNARCADRPRYEPDACDASLGFRLVLRSTSR